MTFKTGMGGKLGISGTLEFRNKAGEVIKTIELNGQIPLSQLGMTPEQAQQLIQQHQEDQHGPDHRQ